MRFIVAPGKSGFFATRQWQRLFGEIPIHGRFVARPAGHVQPIAAALVLLRGFRGKWGLAPWRKPV